MIRIKQIQLADLSDSIASQNYLKSSQVWQREIYEHFSDLVYQNLLPFAQRSGEVVNYFTRLEGREQYFDNFEKLKKEYPDLATTVEQCRSKIVSFLRSSEPLNNQALEAERAEFADLIESISSVMVIDQKNVILLPYILNAKSKKVTPPPVPPKTEPPVNNIVKEQTKIVTPPPVVPEKKGCLRHLLWLLPLLLLLGLLAWYLFNKYYEPKPEPIIEPPVVEEVKEPEPEPEPVKEEIKEPEPEPVKEPEPEPIKEEVKEPEPEPVKEEVKEPEPEPVKEEVKEPEPKPVKEEPKKEPKVAKSNVPKCSATVGGNIENIFIGFDASGSMFIEDALDKNGKRQSRLKVATDSLKSITDKLDDKLNINLIEFSDCPNAKFRGSFKGSNKHKLVDLVNQIVKDKSTSKGGGTPLVSALQMAAYRSMGQPTLLILLSDGDESCKQSEKKHDNLGDHILYLADLYINGTPVFDICSYVKNYHKQYPNIKVDVLYVGSDDFEGKCIAQITQGRNYTAKTITQMEQILATMVNSDNLNCSKE